MMFGYATDETAEFMPMALAFSHRLVAELAKIRKTELHLMPYLRPDVKSQVTILYDDNNKPLYVDTIVVSTQHDDFADDATMLKKINEDIRTILIPRVIPAEMLRPETKFHINPTGKFVIGGPHGDSGLTGRKIIVDTYGGKGAHGGGAFSGKDSSKVDRSAAYASRHIAKNMVAAGLASEVLVQVAYAIGVAKPVSVTVNTYGTAKVSLSDGVIADKIAQLFDLRPKAIVDRFGLKNPIFSETAAYGHMGRKSEEKEITLKLVKVTENPETKTRTEVKQETKKMVTFFPWEKLDYVTQVKEAFGL
jgi:S-adenosylmethionine synthetase